MTSRDQLSTNDSEIFWLVLTGSGRHISWPDNPSDCEFLVHKACSMQTLEASPPPRDKKPHKKLNWSTGGTCLSVCQSVCLTVSLFLARGIWTIFSCSIGRSQQLWSEFLLSEAGLPCMPCSCFVVYLCLSCSLILLGICLWGGKFW